MKTVNTAKTNYLFKETHFFIVFERYFLSILRGIFILTIKKYYFSGIILLIRHHKKRPKAYTIYINDKNETMLFYHSCVIICKAINIPKRNIVVRRYGLYYI